MFPRAVFFCTPPVIPSSPLLLHRAVIRDGVVGGAAADDKRRQLGRDVSVVYTLSHRLVTEGAGANNAKRAVKVAARAVHGSFNKATRCQGIFYSGKTLAAVSD